MHFNLEKALNVKDALEEECWEPERVGVWALTGLPAVLGVDHVWVGGHVLSGQAAVPARGEGHLGPDAATAELGPGREAGAVLQGGVRVTQALVVDVVQGLRVVRTASQHPFMENL